MSADANRLKNLFAAAIKLSDPAGRQAFLDRECAGEPDLRRRLDELLRAHDDPASALERPLGDLADPGTRSFAPADDATTDHPSGPAEGVGAVVAGRYKLVEAIGEGGMGSVYMAQQTEPVRRLIALKVIKAGMDSKAVLARFEAERQALALMDHPNIAKVLDAGTTESGRPFFVMELVKGVPITPFCDQRKLTPRERLELFVPVCQAIQHAHTKGVIHRDIKPSNVLVALYDGKPVPKVIDFGVAKAAGQPLTDKTLVTGFGAIVGTPEYMSPEQAELNQLDIDTRSDVFALGVVLYELLTGTTPLDRVRLGSAALLEVLRIVREEEPPKPSTRISTSAARAGIAASRGTDPARLSRLVRGELDWIVMKSLEKDRNRRYDTPTALARDVERYLAGDSVEACPPTLGYRLRKAYRRNRVAVRAVTAFVCLTLGAAAMGAYLAVQARRAEAEVRLQRDELRRVVIRQTADQIQADLLRLRLAGTTLAATVADFGVGDEAVYIDWMKQMLASEPELLGLCIAFEPDKVAPANSPPLRVDPADPDRDGYSLHVRREPEVGLTAGPLDPKYRYRIQPWYELARGGFIGWEEPTEDRYGPMVSYVHPLKRRSDIGPVGALCVDLSVTYFRRLDARLAGPHFGPGSYAFVLSREGKVIAHPRLPAGTPVFPDVKNVWRESLVFPRILTSAGERVEELAGTDPATERPCRFLFVRFQPADWVLVVVIPDGE